VVKAAMFAINPVSMEPILVGLAGGIGIAAGIFIMIALVIVTDKCINKMCGKPKPKDPADATWLNIRLHGNVMAIHAEPTGSEREPATITDSVTSALPRRSSRLQRLD
jgi:hypothetical protein